MLLSLILFSSFFNLVSFLTFEMETQKLGMMEITDFSDFLVSNIKFSKLNGFFLLLLFFIFKLFSVIVKLLLCKWHFPSPSGLHSVYKGRWRKTEYHSFRSVPFLPCEPHWQQWPPILQQLLVPVTCLFSVLLVQPQDHSSSIYPESLQHLFFDLKSLISCLCFLSPGMGDAPCYS